jgi:hypothetical protein
LTVAREEAGAAHVPVSQVPRELWLPDVVQPQEKPVMIVENDTGPVQEAVP